MLRQSPRAIEDAPSFTKKNKAATWKASSLHSLCFCLTSELACVQSALKPSLAGAKQSVEFFLFYP